MTRGSDLQLHEQLTYAPQQHLRRNNNDNNNNFGDLLLHEQLSDEVVSPVLQRELRALPNEVWVRGWLAR